VLLNLFNNHGATDNQDFPSFVTGASTGFGRLTAETLQREGWLVYGTMRDIHGRNAAARRELESLGIFVLEMDVTQDAEVERTVQRVLDDTVRYDAVTGMLAGDSPFRGHGHLVQLRISGIAVSAICAGTRAATS